MPVIYESPKAKKKHTSKPATRHAPKQAHTNPPVKKAAGTPQDHSPAPPMKPPTRTYKAPHDHYTEPHPPYHAEEHMERSLPHKIMTMGAYIMRPHKVHFATQGKNEQILLFLRKHPITQVPWIFLTVLMLFAPGIFIPIIGSIIGDAFTIPLAYTIIFTIFGYLITFIYAYISFILWYYNINIVTNQRVVDIDFLYLLVQEVTATRISQIEDVTYRRVGSFATLFDYGNVFVQTAGTEVNIEFLAVPKPKQVGKIIY